MKRHLWFSGLFALVLLVSITGERSANAAEALTADRPACTNAEAELEQVYRVYYQSLEDISKLKSYDLFEFNNNAEKYVLVAASASEITTIQSMGFTVVLDEEQTANYRKLDMLASQGLETLPPPYNCYRTVEELYAYGAALASTYPNLAEWTDVGDSWEKSVGQPDGYDMYVLRLTNESITGDKPKLFITASIHAREYAPAELAARFAGYLIENYQTNADVHWLLDYHEIHIMITANPDGRKEAESGKSWRKNTNENYCGPTSSNRGADLNRNFSFYWGCCGGSSTSQCAETYRGPSAGSEPETQAVQNYMTAIFPDQRGDPLNMPAAEDATGVFIDLHSYERRVLWSWGFTENPAPNATDLQTLGRKFAFFNNYTPSPSWQLYITDGSTEDNIYGRLGVAGYCFEVGDAFFESCNTFEFDILPGNLPALIYAAKTARTPYMTPAGPDSINLALSQSSVPAGTIVTLTGQVNDTRYKSGSGEPTQPIAEAQYSADLPYWEAGYAPVALSPADGSFNSSSENVTASINTTGWQPGRHILYVRGKDNLNNWGAVSAIFLTIEGPVNTPPVADGQSLKTRRDLPLNITLTGSDADGDPLSFEVVTNPSRGQLSGALPDLVYTPDPGYIGADSFSFKVWDGLAYSEPAVISIQVEMPLFLPMLAK
ncbi:MAG: M14 family zinc carboxypeptidase [Anaerolineaceae bacterium]